MTDAASNNDPVFHHDWRWEKGQVRVSADYAGRVLKISVPPICIADVAGDSIKGDWKFEPDYTPEEALRLSRLHSEQLSRWARRTAPSTEAYVQLLSTSQIDR